MGILKNWCSARLIPPMPTDSMSQSTVAGGEDDSGPAMINRAILKHPEAKHPVLFCLIAAKAKAAEHGAACGAMMNSIKADGRLGRDKSDYYVRNNDDYDNGEFALHVRDMASFKLLIPAVPPPRNSPWEDLWEVIWARDDQAFYVGDKVLPIADPANFQNLGQGYAKDAGQVYNQGNRVVPE